MKISLTLVPSNVKKDIDIKTGSTIADLLEKLCLKPDTVIVLRKTTPVPEDEALTESQEFKIIQVASGG